MRAIAAWFAWQSALARLDDTPMGYNTRVDLSVAAVIALAFVLLFGVGLSTFVGYQVFKALRLRSAQRANAANLRRK
jgi:hypothetical protein